MTTFDFPNPWAWNSCNWLLEFTANQKHVSKQIFPHSLHLCLLVSPLFIIPFPTPVHHLYHLQVVGRFEMPTKSEVKFRLNSDTKHIAVLQSDPGPLGKSVNVAEEFKCVRVQLKHRDLQGSSWSGLRLGAGHPNSSNSQPHSSLGALYLNSTLIYFSQITSKG